MRQQPVSPVPQLEVPEGRPPRLPEMPWSDPLSSEPVQPDESIDHWPEHIFPGPEGVPDEEGYNPVVDPRAPPPESPPHRPLRG
ncbi:MAG: hypothetical protein Q8P31_10515 [Bacillota bacterium]|nr:hypothetical protein [Bacillota bacterium]